MFQKKYFWLMIVIVVCNCCLLVANTIRVKKVNELGVLDISSRDDVTQERLERILEKYAKYDINIIDTAGRNAWLVTFNNQLIEMNDLS